jgi:secondary thiamine-phosphate synthase enzyme
MYRRFVRCVSLVSVSVQGGNSARSVAHAAKREARRSKIAAHTACADHTTHRTTGRDGSSRGRHTRIRLRRRCLPSLRPHTTAGVLINKSYDPAVAQNLAAAFDRLVPRVANSAHAEGNSDSHIKTALAGSSETVWIVAGKLALGRWQRIFFAEFDGPRSRGVRVKIVSDAAT